MSARRPSASWSTACSTPRKSWSSRWRPSSATSACSPAIPFGDGSVIMIIDPNGVSQEIGAAVAGAVAAHADTEAEQHTAVENRVSLLVFRAGSPEPKAVPLSLITRLEEIDCKKIELSNGRHMVQYRGQLMPLVCTSGEFKIKREGAQPLLVFSDGHRSMGLVVDEIVDIVE